MSNKSTVSEQSTNLSTEERTICNGSVVLFIRKNSKRWQARIRRNTGEWIKYSTKQIDFDKACSFAEERYRSIEYAQKFGKIDVTKKFSSICHLVRKELEEEIVRTGQIYLNDLIAVIDRYILPILGDYMCHNIDLGVLRKFSIKRQEMIGHRPVKSTVSTHNTALNRLFNKAKERNFIETIPKTINDGVKGKRRPYFKSEEFKSLFLNSFRYLRHSKKLLDNPKGRNGSDRIGVKSYLMRELLCDIIPFLYYTGIRPGKELLYLKWKNLSIVQQDGFESINISLPHSKTIERVVIAFDPIPIYSPDDDIHYDDELNDLIGDPDKRYGCWGSLKRIQSRFEALKDLSWNKLFDVDEYIFRYSNGERAITGDVTKTFKRLLKWSNYNGVKGALLTDNFNDERTPYSLRHSYASERRKEGMTYDDLSEQMGTSVKLISEIYSHFKVSDNPNRFSGSEDRLRQEQQQKKDDNSDLIKHLLEQNLILTKKLKEHD